MGVNHERDAIARRQADARIAKENAEWKRQEREDLEDEDYMAFGEDDF